MTLSLSKEETSVYTLNMDGTPHRLADTHLLFINIYISYHIVTISSKERFTATGLGASSLKLYRKLYIINLLDLDDIMYNLEINYYAAATTSTTTTTRND